MLYKLTNKRLERLNENGYNVIRLSKHYALVRNWSTHGFRIRNCIPFYKLVKVVDYYKTIK